MLAATDRRGRCACPPSVALVTAVLALRARPDRQPLGLPWLRRLAAAAIVLWTLTTPVAWLLGGLGLAGLSDLDWMMWQQLLGTTVLLAIAAVVWQRDSLSAVPASLVVAVFAGAGAFNTLLGRLMGQPGFPGVTFRLDAVLGVLLVVAGVVTVAAVLLWRAARTQAGEPSVAARD